MGNKTSKSKNSTSDSNNNINNASKNISKKKRKWLPFSIKKKENKIAQNIIRASKRKHSEKKRRLEPQPTQPPQVLAPKPNISTIQDYDAKMIDLIKQQLVKDSRSFMLNQLMLSMQFYGNYKRETEESFAEMTKKECDVSMRLSKHLKSVILTDCIQSAANKKVKYQASFGPIKGQFLSLDTQSVYIVCNNIEVTRDDETDSIYGMLPDPTVYKMVMEDHTDQARHHHSRISYKGYVKLRSVDFYDKLSRDESSGIGSFMAPSTINDVVDDVDGIQLYDEDEKFECESMYSMDARSVKSIRGMKDVNGKSVCIVNGMPYSASSSNETSRGSSEYDYTYITAFNAHKPFGSFVSTMNEKLSTTTIPVRCITPVVIDEDLSQGYESDNEGSDEADGESTLKDEPTYQLETRPYLSSKEFFAYFSSIFRSHLGPELGFQDRVFDKATYKGATICIPLGGESYEITPAIQCPWPNEALEWDKRNRKAIENSLTKKSYQWPTQNMINKVMEFGCHVIPVGFAPKHGKNMDREIEWKIVFPLAERYLEQKFDNAQAKIYMVLKALLRAFVDPYLENGENMFTKEHLRAFMFWQCEESPNAWNENCLGEKLLTVLAALQHRIQTQNLPDYFLPRRNLFENVPERNLIQIQTRLSWIRERPVNYLLIVMRDLKFVKNFYPKIRSVKLYNALVIKDPLVKLNPILDSSVFDLSAETKSDNENTENVKPASRRPSEAVGSMAEIEKRGLESARVKPTKNPKKLRASPNKFQRKKVSVQGSPPPKPNPKEPIDVKVNLCKKLEPARQRLLFDLFIPHFIEMSQYALQKEKAIPVAQIAIRQAERLSRILYEQDDKGQQYLDQIEPVKKGIDFSIRQLREEGPNKPRRGSLTGPLSISRRPSSLMGSRKSSMIEDPYVNLAKAMTETAITEETTEDEDARNRTLTATRGPKQRTPIQQVVITAQIHAITPNVNDKQHITAEDIIENAYKRHGLAQNKTTEDVRDRA